MADIKTPEIKAPEYLGTGRRKTAVARVRLATGTGKITVNGRPFENYFPVDTLRGVVSHPLTVTGTADKLDAKINVSGGGPNGQAGAVRHGISKALTYYEPELRPVLKKGGFLTRDSRVVERKKYGKMKARRSFQFSKR